MESTGDLVVAVSVLVVLWDDVARGPLLLWGLLVAITVFGWDTFGRTRPLVVASTTALFTWFGWGSGMGLREPAAGSVAAPIRRGELFAFTVFGPEPRLQDADRDKLARLLLGQAQDLKVS